MAEAIKQAGQAQAATKEITLDSVINEAGAAVGARTEGQKSEVERQVRTLAEQVLAKADVVDKSNLTATISAIIAEIDRKLTEQVNRIIHHEKFQKLEGTWRGLYHLVNNTETDEMLKIKVLNISKKEIARVFKRFDGVKFDQSPLFKKIYQGEGSLDMGFGTLGGHPFGCLIGDYYFDHSPEDVLTLGGMAQVSAAAHAPFIAGAAPGLLGMESWQELIHPPDITKIFENKAYLPWKSLRESEDSRYIGLTMPRFLSRLPYGAKTTPVEGFHFEEETEGADSSKYVWSNAAFAMGANITRAFKNYGWCTQIRGVDSGGKVAQLPCHTFPTADGDTDLKCPTEIAIPDTRDGELSKNGLMALCYAKNSTDAAFIGGQSLQKPKTFQGKGAEAANQNANLSARLTYLFATCRFGHYLKCMLRDKVGAMMERGEVQIYLQDWINNYVLPNPEDANQELKARKPLAGAEVEVKEIEGNPGYYNAVFRLRPHFQLEGVNVSLRLVGKLKQGGG